MFFEDLQPGATFMSRGRTITETDLVMFAALSGDYSEFTRTPKPRRHRPRGPASRTAR